MEELDLDPLAQELAFAFAFSGKLGRTPVVEKYAAVLRNWFERHDSGKLKWDNNSLPPKLKGKVEGLIAHVFHQKAKDIWRSVKVAQTDAIRSFLFLDPTLTEWRGLSDLQKKKMQIQRKEANMEKALRKRVDDTELKDKLENTKKELEELSTDIEYLTDQDNLKEVAAMGESQANTKDLKLELVDASKLMADRTDAMKQFCEKFVLMVEQPNNDDYNDYLKQHGAKFQYNFCRNTLEQYRREEPQQKKETDEENKKPSKKDFQAPKWISPRTIIQQSKVVLNGAPIDMSEADTEDSFLHHLESEVDEATFHQLFCQDWPCFGIKLPEVFDPYIQRRFQGSGQKTRFTYSFGEGIEEDEALRHHSDLDKMYTCKVIYFPAEPGMGKTTFVDSLANKFKAKESHRLKLVHMVTLQDLMRNLKTEPISTEAVFGLKSDFEKRLFERNKKNVLLFLDGLDEIHQQEEVLRWVRSVQHGMEHIFITGRLGTEPVVKQCLNDYSMWRFLLLNKEQLKDFFTKWWNKESKEELDQERLADYVEEAVERCEENSRLKNMIGIPLMAQMMAVVFQEHAESYCKGGPMKTITDQTDIDSLYESFFDGKWEIFRRRHLSGLDASNLKILKSHYETLHQHLGFENIFAGKITPGCRSPHRECSFFSDEGNLEAVLQHGIIKQAVKEGDSVTYFFQHRTFAEYSAAMFIIKGVNEATHSKAAREAYKLIFIKEEDSAQ